MNRVTKCRQLTRPVLRTAAGFHADAASLSVIETVKEVTPLNLYVFDDAVTVDAEYLNDILCNVDAHAG
jgi:hypothetical protein